MKVCFQVIAFNAADFLDECLTTLEAFGYPIVCAEGPVQYWQERGFRHSTDTTREILEEHRVHTVSSRWQEKDDMVNAALALIPKDTTHIWEVDADEIYKPKDIEGILDLLEHEGFDAIAFKTLSFFAGFTHVMGGFEHNFPFHRIQRYYPGCKWETHRPPTILAPDGRPWREHKFLDANQTACMNLLIYHYSYTMPNVTAAKIQYYESKGGTIPNYFQEVWLPWARGDGREAIENKWDGVHNWLPERRGSARTEVFGGQHPRIIENHLPKLKEQFDQELAKWN